MKRRGRAGKRSWRAPWRWSWGQILRLLTIWAVVAGVCCWAPILSLAVAIWFVAWVRAGYRQPLPSPTGRGPLEGEEAGQKVESKYGGAQITVTVGADRRSYRTGG